MKKLKLISWILLASAFTLVFDTQLLAQNELPEFTVTAARYKYLNSVNPEEAAQPVNMLEHYTAAYDIKSAEFYEDVYDNYVVSFFIPDGKILAAYDKDGTLLRTAERYKNSALPPRVQKAVTQRFPNWSVSKDVYIVKYYKKQDEDVSKKIYKLVLQNGEERMKVKINDQGEFL